MMGTNYTFVNGRYTPVGSLSRPYYGTYDFYTGHSYYSSYGRRRYISRTASDSLNYGTYGNYNNYPYSLPNNDYAVPNLSVYGSGLPSYDVMSRYTSKKYDTQKTYDTPKSYDSSIGSYGYVSRSHGLGDTSRYGSAGGQSYLGTSYDLSSGSHGGSTYDGRSFGTDERLPHTGTEYNRYRDTSYTPYEHRGLYTSSKLEDYVTADPHTPRSNWRDAYHEKYGRYDENQEVHRPYQFKNGNNENKDEHVSSDLEEPSPYPSYYSRYRERHKRDKSKPDPKHEETSAKGSDLTPSEKLAIIRQKIHKRDKDDDELERPPSYELSQESTPRSLLSPVSNTFNENTDHIPKWRQHKVLETLTYKDENQPSVSKHYEYHSKNDDENKIERTLSSKGQKFDDALSSEISSSSPLAEWRRRRQEWEKSASQKSEEKIETTKKQEKQVESDIKVPRPSRHEYDHDPKHEQELEKAHTIDAMSHIGELRSKADAVKNILRQRDSPILRSRYNEARRKQELSKDSSKDDGSDTHSRTSSVDLGSSRPASSDFSDSSRPSSFIFGTDFVPHNDSSKGYSDKYSHVRSRSNVQHMKDSVQLSDDSGFIDTVRDVPKSDLRDVETPKAIHEKLRSRKERREIPEKQGQKGEDKMHSLLYGSTLKKDDQKSDININKENKMLSKEKDKIKSEKKSNVELPEDQQFFRGRTHLQKFKASEKGDKTPEPQKFDSRPKSVTEIHKPLATFETDRPKSAMFGQVFTPKTAIETDKSKQTTISQEQKSKVTSDSTTSQSVDTTGKTDNQSVVTKISEQRKRLQGLYKKAQTTDIASLLSKERDDSDSEENSTASSISVAESESDRHATTPITFAELSKLSRVERIAKYKEERRKQLAYIANRFGDKNTEKEKGEIVPSLFLSARQFDDDKSALNRSQSVKIGTPQKSVAPVVRSKSLHGDTDSPRSKVSLKMDTEKSMTASPEEEIKSPREKYYEKLAKRDHKVSIGESDNEDETIDQINARTREALSSMIRKDVKKSHSDLDHKSKDSRSDIKEQQKNLDTSEQDDQKKSNYMFSMEKMRNKFLFGEGNEKTQSSDKQSAKIITEDDSALDKPQKRRRQLPSIPAALGESPETTRPKSSIEFSTVKEKSTFSPVSEINAEIDQKKRYRQRQIYSENDVKKALKEAEESSVLERKGDFVSFRLDKKGGSEDTSKSHVKPKSSSTSSVEQTLKSSEVNTSTPKHVLKRYQRTAPTEINQEKTTTTQSISTKTSTDTASSSKNISRTGTPKSPTTGVTSATKTASTSAIKSETKDKTTIKSKTSTVSDATKTDSTSAIKSETKDKFAVKSKPDILSDKAKTESSSTKIDKKPTTAFAVKAESQVLIAPSDKKLESKTSKAESSKSASKIVTTAESRNKPSAKIAATKMSTSNVTKTISSTQPQVKISSQSRITATSALTTSSSIVSHPKTVSTVTALKTVSSTSASQSANLENATKTVNTVSTPKVASTTSAPKTVSTVSAPKVASTTSAPKTVSTVSAPKVVSTTSAPKTVSTTSAPKTDSTASAPKSVINKAGDTKLQTPSSSESGDTVSVDKIVSSSLSEVDVKTSKQNDKVGVKSDIKISAIDTAKTPSTNLAPMKETTVNATVQSVPVATTVDLKIGKPLAKTKTSQIMSPSSAISSVSVSCSSVSSTHSTTDKSKTHSSSTSSTIPAINTMTTASSVKNSTKQPKTDSVMDISVASTVCAPKTSTVSISTVSSTVLTTSSAQSTSTFVSSASTISAPKTSTSSISSVSFVAISSTAAPSALSTTSTTVSTKSIDIISSSSVVSTTTKPPSTTISTAVVSTISVDKESSVSVASPHTVKHSTDSKKSDQKHGLKSKPVSRSKSLTDKDSPLQSPRSPLISPRIKTVGVLADSPDLDDILMENVEYLSDVEICNKDKLQQGPVAQALSADQHHHHKTKRSLRKKVLQRSKSDADKHQKETEGSSQDKSLTEQTTVSMATDDLSASDNLLNEVTFVKAKESKAEDICVLTAGPEKHTSVEEKLVTDASGTIVSQDQSQVAPSGGKPRLSKSSNSSFTSSFDLELFPKEAEKSSGQSSKIDSFDNDSSKVSIDSFEEEGRDMKSDSDRKKRKDKSSKRKSSLNKNEGLSGGDKSSITSSLSSESSEQVTSKSSVTNSTSNPDQHGKSVLDHLLPSKFSFPSKVSSAISKFSHENDTDKKEDTTKAPPKITRKNNFSSLLQRFSSPEPQDGDSRKQGSLRRQEAYSVSSASSDDSRRSTPERSQSLRIKRTPPPDDIETTKGVQRSGSFKSTFMRRRYSPEPKDRRALPDIPDKVVSEHVQSEDIEETDEMKSSRTYLCTSSDKPTDELAGILKQRKEHVKLQQKDGEKEEKERITSKKIEKAEKVSSAADVDEVIENSEVLSILKERRKETDSKVTNGIEDQNLAVSDEHLLVQSTKSVTEVSSLSQESGVKIVPRIARKSSHDHAKSHVTSSNMAPTKSDISDIDTSLAVLDAVSQDIAVPPSEQNTKRKLSSEDIGTITKALSKVNIDSPEQVTTFIKDVRRTSLGKIETDSSQLSIKETTKDRKDDFKSESIDKKEEQNGEIKSAIVHEKVNELRKSPERKSRMSPKLLEKVKETEAKLASLGTVNLKRSESYGHKEGENHKPKGILKRTTSMKKAGVVVDPELATILQRRRSRHEEDGVEVETGSKVTPSAKDDIQESLRREQALCSGLSKDEDDKHMPSISERIFHMEAKLEETKSCPITPKSRSGATTPKLSSLYRSGSSTSQSFDQEEVLSFTGNHLLQKLNTLAEQRTSSVEEKRRSFQKRPRDDWRTRTQPVTEEELEEAGNLASVQAFRAEVLRKASSNVFEQLSKQEKQTSFSKRLEFPQHIPRKRRGRGDRHKTLPITAAELGSVPESEVISIMSYRLKTMRDMRDSKADSGIMSGSDIEGYDSARSDSSRSVSMEAELNEDDPARLSVSAKASIFKNISEKKSASGAKRYIDRKKRERSRTLPVTDDEVHSAAEIADGEGETTDKKEVVDEETEGIHDEKSKRSLAEKVQLFQNLKKDEEKPAAKSNVPPPVARRRKGKLASRFSTQPVTVEEVEKAAKISPLAMSLAKPPDPELLKGLSLSAQREIMAKHAEASLSQPGSRSSSRHGSMGDLSDESKKGILKSSEKIHTETSEVHGILKPEQAKSPERDVKGILKPDHIHVSDTEQRSILKHSEEVVSTKVKSVDQKGILKHEEEIISKDSSVKAILKHEDKKVVDSEKMKPILKHDGEKFSESDKKSVKPILKHEDQKSFEKHQDSEGSVKAILRKNSAEKSEELKPILKHLDASDDSVRSKDFDKKRKSLEEELHLTPILKHLDASDDSVRSKDFDKKRKSLEGDLHFTPILKHADDKESEKSSDVKGVLKKEKSADTGEPKGILKKESSFETKVSEPEKSALKKSPSRELKEQKLHGILHKSSDDENLDINLNKADSKTMELDLEGLDDTATAAQKRRGRDPADKERYLTQPAESTPEKSPETPRKFKYSGRHKTQPITPEEKRDAEIDTTITRSGSLKDRLNSLKQSGEEEWKKRVHRTLDLESTPSPAEVKLREKVISQQAMARPSSIADRLNLLNTAQAGWKERVEETDAIRFTVAHKLAGQVEDSPLMKKLKSRNKRESESESGSEIPSPSTPSKEWPKIPFPQTLISDPTAKVEPKETTPPPEQPPVMEEEEQKGSVKVTVPDMNDESMKSFFHSREITELSSQKVDVSIDDFNEIFIVANDMLPSIQRIRPKRKHQGSFKNPLKSIHTTVEIKTEYEEVIHGVAEKEVKRIKTEKISRGAGFAQAALAGLASTEDFSNVSLRRTDSLKGLNSIDPYKDLMLLHVKGRRRTQVRLVEPVPTSINSGDCYILVTPDKIIQWIGEYANVIEKSKVADIAAFIQQKKDLGCKSPTTVAVVEEKRQQFGAGKHFWAALGGQATVASAGPPEEDELYENHIVETNLVYRLVENALVPYKEYWGSVPKIEMLKKDEVIVFDFGSELYVWQGKAVKPDQRKLGVKLARKLWENGYDYSAAVINPLCPLKTEECGGMAMTGSKRPDWALFGKVNQNMETILFREKFADWPDNSRLIQVKGPDDKTGSKVDLTELKPYDANLMVQVKDSPVTLVLEGSHVGRGTEWDEDMDGFIRKQSIVTLGVKVWHVLEYDHYELEEISYGQFHDGDTYVVRWQYMITNKESKDLKGSQSRRSLVGRERCAYFFWQGKNSTINEKGASALMTVELDEERGPQIRVDEGKEIPCFLNLFNGETIVHIGKREEESTNTQGPWKCYCVRNVVENEMCLIEVLADMSSFRSRSSFLLLNVHTGKLYVWHGCQSPKNTQKLAMAAVEKLKKRCPLEVGLNRQATLACTEIEEGKETLDFWRVMDTTRNDRSLYCSLLTESKEMQSIRLYHMTSVSGSFDVQEILNPTRVPDLVSPFPVLQSDLYRTSQPELFMLDSGDMVYLWHGWWPEANSEVENVQTGSAQAKFNVDRSCAIQTALEYCKVKHKEHPLKPVAVYAGLEPLEFTNLFPYWEVNGTARQLNIKDGKKDNEVTPLAEILQKMMQTRYTFEELQERPLPEGVDALRLESYLDDEEFEEYLQMTKDEFYALPSWKQHATKKDVGLF